MPHIGFGKSAHHIQPAFEERVPSICEASDRLERALREADYEAERRQVRGLLRKLRARTSHSPSRQKSTKSAAGVGNRPRKRSTKQQVADGILKARGLLSGKYSSWKKLAASVGIDKETLQRDQQCRDLHSMQREQKKRPKVSYGADDKAYKFRSSVERDEE